MFGWDNERVHSERTLTLFLPQRFTPSSISHPYRYRYWATVGARAGGFNSRYNPTQSISDLSQLYVERLGLLYTLSLFLFLVRTGCSSIWTGVGRYLHRRWMVHSVSIVRLSHGPLSITNSLSLSFFLSFSWHDPFLPLDGTLYTNRHFSSFSEPPFLSLSLSHL